MRVYHERVEEGCFVFQVIRNERVYIQPAPLLEDDEDEDEEDDDHFEENELVAVDMIQPCSLATFVRLADQSGWLVAESHGEVFLRQVPVTTGQLTVMYADSEQTVRRHPMDDTSEFLNSEQPDDTMPATAPCWKLQPMQKIYCDASVQHPVTGVKFYRLQGVGSKAAPASPGWVFEKSQKNEYKLLPANKISTGLFAFRAKRSIVVRDQPDCTDESMTSFTLEEGSLAVADLLRESPVVDNGNGPFVRLSDGSGWLFQKKRHEETMEPVPIQAGHWILTILNDPDGLIAVKQPVGNHRAVESKRFHFGSVVECDRCIENQGTAFYRVIGTEEWLCDKHRGRRTLSLLQQVGQPATLSASWDIQFIRGMLATAKHAHEISYNEESRIMTVSAKDQTTIKLFCATRAVGVFFRLDDKPQKRFIAECTVEQLVDTFNRNLEETIAHFDGNKRQVVDKGKNSDHGNDFSDIEEEKKDDVGDLTAEKVESEDDGTEEGPYAAPDAADRRMCEIAGPALIEREEDMRKQLLACDEEIAAVAAKRMELVAQLKQFDTDRDDAAMKQIVKSRVQQQKHKDEYALRHEIQSRHNSGSASKKSKLKTRKYKQVSSRSNESNSLIDKETISEGSSSLSSKALHSVAENIRPDSGGSSVRSSVRAQVQCGECHKKFSGKYSRDLHCRHVHKLFCESCDKIFPSFLELEAHIDEDICHL